MKVNREGQALILTKEDELEVILAMAEMREGVRNIALFQLGIYTSLRINELRMLDVGNVMDERGEIREYFTIESRKTKTKQPRTVHIIDIPARALKEYLKTRPGAQQEEPLFTVAWGQRIGLTTASRIFEVAFRKAQIKGASTHSMRRTCLTRLADAEVHMSVIQKIAGHASISQTARYIEVRENQKRDALNKLTRSHSA